MEHVVQAVTVRWYNACADYAVALARGFTELGHRVTLAGREETPALQRARESKCNIFAVPGASSRGIISFGKQVHACRKFALENEVTLVNAHHGHDHLVWMLALKGTGIPLVRTSGNQIPPGNHAGSRLLMKKTAGIIASCRTIRGFYADGFGINPEHIPIIHGGVDSMFYRNRGRRSELREALGLPQDAFVFGILARFSPDKGHSTFFGAAEKVAKDHHDAWFVVAGWNAQIQEREIRSMASAAGILERTCFAGRHHDSRDLIGVLDAGVIASVRSETICRIAMEYMAMEVPVIAADTNVIPEIVRHGQSGYVVPRGDSRAMAEAMRDLIESKEKIRTYGRNGRAIVEREYSLAAFAEQTLEAYGSILIND